jgi:glycosyltransferase involved in cell wall biosynthesis
MKIAIQAADLDASRIDGTRVYIKNILKYFGALDKKSDFLIYHKNKFNPELAPPNFPNYRIIAKFFPCFWTQISFANSLWKDKPDVLWMPMHNIPYFIPRKIKTVITIHDLAFKYFPKCFTRWDLWKLSFLTKMALKKADKIIAVSESSRRDILKFYPEINEEKIQVINHGFSQEVFKKERNREKEETLKNELKISGKYVLYVGALQPRKNLEVLIKAFEKVKENEKNGDLKLVLLGEKAWLWESIFKKIEVSPFKSDIITPGKINFENTGHLMRGAEIFCFPSLYEGFGIPILEAFAARVPVICADNSSLPEVAGKAAIYFNDHDSEELSEKIKTVLEDEKLRNNLVSLGEEQIKKFSWEKCARETLEYLKN